MPEHTCQCCGALGLVAAERNRLLGRVMELSNAHNALEDALKVVTDDWRAAEAALAKAIEERDAVTDKLYDALARVAALEAQVRGDHQADDVVDMGGDPFMGCVICGRSWPCAVLTALGLAPTEREG